MRRKEAVFGVKSAVSFWVITPSDSEKARCFIGTYRLHLQGGDVFLQNQELPQNYTEMFVRNAGFSPICTALELGRLFCYRYENPMFSKLNVLIPMSQSKYSWFDRPLCWLNLADYMNDSSVFKMEAFHRNCEIPTRLTPKPSGLVQTLPLL